MALYIISQILVCIADLFYVVSMFAKKKIHLVTFLFVSDVLFASHYLLLKGGLTGALTISLDCVYLVAMYLLEKYNKTKYNLIATIIAMIATIVLSVVTWQGAISLLPMVAMLCYLTTMIFTNIVIVKLGSFLRNLLNIIYMFLIASYFGAGLEIVLMISAIVGIVLDIKRKKKLENNIVDNTQAPTTIESEDVESKNNIENN